MAQTATPKTKNTLRLAALEYGGASANALLPLVLQMGKALPPSEFTALVSGPVVKLFASPDRGTRMALLDHLPEFAEHLDQKTVTDKVWPHLQTGFADTVAVIREATLRSIILISTKLSDRILNNELLRHLAKAQTDPEASIRTNTCILIGRLAPTLKPVTQNKMLVPAFSRALKDNFVHARVAGLMALMATVALFDPDELASRVVPAMSFALVDKEKLVRDQAFKAMDMFVKRLEAHAASMPETIIPADANISTAYSAPSGQSALVSTASGAAGALAGWAMSSLNRTLATSDMQSTMNVQSNGIHQTSEMKVPGLPIPLGAPALSAPATPLGGAFSSTGARGLQLGANKIPQSAIHHSLAEDLEKEAAAELGLGNDAADDAWGADGDDLIDVNADAGDWSAFTSAPAVDADDDAAWGESLEVDPPTPVPSSHDNPTPSRPPTTTSISTSSVTKTLPAPSRPTTAPSPSPRTTVVQSIPDDWETPQETVASPVPATSMAGLSKEEKALEMARRREERKQRIAQLKEKKGTKA